jgi:hypothetical protein
MIERNWKGIYERNKKLESSFEHLQSFPYRLHQVVRLNFFEWLIRLHPNYFTIWRRYFRWFNVKVKAMA